jgi:hypothetical protein
VGSNPPLVLFLFCPSPPLQQLKKCWGPDPRGPPWIMPMCWHVDGLEPWPCSVCSFDYLALRSRLALYLLYYTCMRLKRLGSRSGSDINWVLELALLHSAVWLFWWNLSNFRSWKFFRICRTQLLQATFEKLCIDLYTECLVRKEDSFEEELHELRSSNILAHYTLQEFCRDISWIGACKQSTLDLISRLENTWNAVRHLIEWLMRAFRVFVPPACVHAAGLSPHTNTQWVHCVARSVDCANEINILFSMRPPEDQWL